MFFLTEEDVRARCSKPGCTLRLGPAERLTPSAAEFAAQMRAVVTQGEAPCAAPAPCAATVAAAEAPAAPCADARDCCQTHLDASTMVPKSHPRIVLRGKLDSLLAVTLVVQSQFDPRKRLPEFLKNCLADLNTWVMQVLAAEVSGSVLSVAGMGGMDPETLRTVSRDPAHYLGVEHYSPDAGSGTDAILLNWLRTVARETEVAAAQCDLCRADIAGALNRLSSAVYVLLLLTLAAEKGVDVTKLNR